MVRTIKRSLYRFTRREVNFRRTLISHATGCELLDRKVDPYLPISSRLRRSFLSHFSLIFIASNEYKDTTNFHTTIIIARNYCNRAQNEQKTDRNLHSGRVWLSIEMKPAKKYTSDIQMDVLASFGYA